jgi:hypothetical protein
MPKIFGLQLFSSFHHQLNCYGFKKIDVNEYYNKYFTRDDKNLLTKIKRRKKKNKLENDDKLMYSIRHIEYQINNIKNTRNNLENKLYRIQKRQEYLINENNFLRNKLFEAQTKQKDLGYIFFSMVENLIPEFSMIKKQCMYFINSKTLSLPNISNNNDNSDLKEYNMNKIDSGISLCNTQDTKTQEEFDNYIDVE